MSVLREIRILPIVLVAVLGLTVLKVAGLALDGGYVFDYNPNAKQDSWAQQMLNFPGAKGYDNDITGSVPDKKAEAKPVVAPAEARPAVGPVPTEPPTPMLASERAILERLQTRRQELETRAREIEIRESLLKAAEKRIEDRVEELKGVEARITSATGAKNDADAARFKGIVTMYEGMKPKDAAKIFDRLEMSVLIEIASQIAPRKMSDIVGLMLPEAAEKLTIELARRATGGDKPTSLADLPKIEGRPMPTARN